VSERSLTVPSVNCWLNQLTKISSSLSAYFIAVVLLHVAFKISQNDFNDDLMDSLSVVIGQYFGPRRYSSRRSSELLLSEAASLINAVDDKAKSRNTLHLIATELPKAYLYRALSCEDSDSDSISIYCLANVYSAVLYYTAGQYQTAIDHCTLVMRSQDHSQCSSHVVQGELLPKTDGGIITVLGFVMFYQHVRSAALNQQQQTQHVTVFTTERFAHYLLITRLSVTECQQLNDTTNVQSSIYEVQSYGKYIADMKQLFTSDVLLWKLVSGFSRCRFVYKRQSDIRHYSSKRPIELNSSDLVALDPLLQQSAIEQLTIFRQMDARQTFVL